MKTPLHIDTAPVLYSDTKLAIGLGALIGIACCLVWWWRSKRGQ